MADSKRPRSSIEDVGIELITHILHLGQFSASRLCQLSTLSRDWKEACESKCLWEKLHLKVPEYSEYGLQRISSKCTSLTEIMIDKDPRHPRALSLHYCSPWIEGMESVFKASENSLERLIVTAGCNIYHRDYRSAPFYRQLMRKVAMFSKQLKHCEIYYNAGRCGMEKEIPKWMLSFINGCRHMTSFSFWTPATECGSVDNTMLMAMAVSWPKLKSLEVSGEDITLQGVMFLRFCNNLKELKLRHISLGVKNRPAELMHAEAIILNDKSHTPLETIELWGSNCDVTDLKILLVLFPTISSIILYDVDHTDNESDSEGEDLRGDADDARRQEADLQFLCLQDPTLNNLVNFR